METIRIRKATINDCESLLEIGKITFSETFASTNSEGNMKDYLAKNFSKANLTLEINNPLSEFYLAFLEKRVIGFLKVNFGKAQTEIQDEKGIELERIYVLNEFHGKKIGQLLLDKALQIARNNESQYLWLGVWENNFKALKFYEKNWFYVFDKHIFTLGTDEQTDLLMKIDL